MSPPTSYASVFIGERTIYILLEWKNSLLNILPNVFWATYLKPQKRTKNFLILDFFCVCNCAFDSVLTLARKPFFFPICYLERFFRYIPHNHWNFILFHYITWFWLIVHRFYWKRLILVNTNEEMQYLTILHKGWP